jgi:hypothetical protein
MTALLGQVVGRYRRVGRLILRPVRGVDLEVHRLHQVEQAGDSGETPFIAVAGLLVFLVSVFVLMLGVSFLAYYLG